MELQHFLGEEARAACCPLNFNVTGYYFPLHIFISAHNGTDIINIKIIIQNEKEQDENGG